MTVGVIHIKELSSRNYRTGTSFYKSNIDELKLYPMLEVEVFNISNAASACLNAINGWKPDTCTRIFAPSYL